MDDYYLKWDGEKWEKILPPSPLQVTEEEHALAMHRYKIKRNRKYYFTMQISADDRQLIAMLATRLNLSQSAAIRLLIRQEAEAQGLRID